MAHSSLPFLKRAIVQARFAWLTAPTRPETGVSGGGSAAPRDPARVGGRSSRPISRRGGRTSHPSLDRMPLRFPDAVPL